MPKLSRRGWNNVLIFCCLAFILIFSRVGQDDLDATTHRLLPEHVHVLSWEGATWRIERVGTTWRSLPELNIPTEQLSDLIHAWQAWHLPPSAPLRGQPQRLTVWVANSDIPVTLNLYQDNGTYALQNWRGDWLALEEAQYRQLLQP